MAIVNLKSTVFGVTGVAGYTAPNGSARDGRIHRVAGRISNGAGDSNLSKYLICELPWSAILLPPTAFMTTAWGFAQAVIGTDEDSDGLLDVARATGGATGNVPITIFGAKWNLPFWGQMGLASAPLKGFAKLYAVAEADATGAGTLDFDIHYALYL
ncbi:MAG: hypothetical protein V4712_17710 [Pseudomonadota bacterium]